MSSGLSMSSVNKIKELAAAREYSLALDIIESQDLTKSLNPQFLRTCGEVYIETKHYAEARKVLLMAHRMAPEAKRIMFSLIDLYYRIGYWDVARKYYDIYMFDADESAEETIQLTYLKNKAEGSDLAMLRELLGNYYADNMDYQWSYELFILLWLNDLKDEADALYMDYSATYKNSEYADTISDIIKGSVDAKECFYIYAPQPVEDDEESQEELRQQEMLLLEADELRIHPKEPEITIMVDDFEEPTLGSKRKLKKLLKKHNASNETEDSDDSVDEAEQQTAAASEQNETVDERDSEEGTVMDAVSEESSEADSDYEESEELDDGNSEKKGFIWKLFNKRKSQEELDIRDEIEESSEEKPEDNYSKDNMDEEISLDEENHDGEEAFRTEEDATYEASQDNEFENSDEASNEEPNEYEPENDIEDIEFEEIEMEDFDFMPEEEKEEKGISVSVDIDNVFEPEEKSFFVFEDVKIIDDEDDETGTDFEIDDFSDNEDDFGVDEEEQEGFSHNTDTESIFEDSDDDNDNSADELNDLFADIDSLEEQEKHVEDEMWFKLDDNEEQEEPEVYVGEIIFDDESDADVENDKEPEEISESEEEAETTDEAESEEEVEMADEAEADEEVEMTDEAEADEEVEMTDEAEAEEEAEMTDEAEVEEEVEMTDEAETEEEVEIVDEAEIETEPDASIDDSEYTDSVVEEEFDVEEFDEEQLDEGINKEDRRSVFEVESDKKSSYDFPVFKSSLFPNYNNESQDIENNFDSVMDEAQNKLKENMLKEEQMQKEAEALLASLGIVLEGASTDDSKQSMAVPEESDDIQQKLNREDLKASIIIDENKKKILRKLKELR